MEEGGKLMKKELKKRIERELTKEFKKNLILECPIQEGIGKGATERI